MVSDLFDSWSLMRVAWEMSASSMVLLVAVSVLCGLFSNQILAKWLTSWGQNARNILAVVLTVLAQAPFFYGLTSTGPGMHVSQTKLVKNRREGRQMIYFLADHHVRTIIAFGREHIEEH